MINKKIKEEVHVKSMLEARFVASKVVVMVHIYIYIYLNIWGQVKAQKIIKNISSISTSLRAEAF